MMENIQVVEKVNVSLFRKDLKDYLGKTRYGNQEFRVRNYETDVAWIAPPEKMEMLKPFEKLYELVEDKDLFLKELQELTFDDENRCDAEKMLELLTKHLSKVKK